MPFVLKETKEKVKAGYKTIYLRQSVIDILEQMARENSTSFNNVVVSMIDYVCEVKNMPDWKEIYLHLFRETERAKNIQIDAQQHCEEMYISALEHELRVLPKQDEEEARIYVTNTPDYEGMYRHLLLETHKAVLVLMDAQIRCEGMSMNSMSTELMMMSNQDKRGLMLDKEEQKNPQT